MNKDKVEANNASVIAQLVAVTSKVGNNVKNFDPLNSSTVMGKDPRQNRMLTNTAIIPTKVINQTKFWRLNM